MTEPSHPPRDGGFKGLHRVRSKRADGAETVYYYAWRGGPRLEAVFGTPEFREEFDLLHAGEAGGRRAASAPTLTKLLDSYQDSQKFKGRAQRTRQDYSEILNTLRLKFGDVPIASLNERGIRATVLDWRDEYGEDSARQADYHLAVLNIAVNWALDREWSELDRNPFAKAGKLYNADRSDKTWSAEQIRRLLAVAPVHVALPFLLALYTGQRQGDLLALCWKQYDGTRINLRQSKTKRHVSVKLAGPAKAALDAARAALPAPPTGEDHILVTARGGDAWTEYGFRNSWAKVKAEAGIVGRTFHDLRGTAATLYAMAGATVVEIATMTGHSLSDVQSILDKNYIHRDVRLSDSGVDKVDAMLGAMAAVANDVVIGGERAEHQPNGAVGRKRQAREKAGEAA